MMRMMNSAEQGSVPVPESGTGLRFEEQPGGGLSFSKMLERFYMNQSPSDPESSDFVPPANLKERKQD